VTSTGNNASNGEKTAARGPRDSASLLQRLGEGVSVWDLEVTRAWAITAKRGHAYLAGELGVVCELRRILLGRGLSADQISAKPYWRAGMANASHGEPERP